MDFSINSQELVEPATRASEAPRICDSKFMEVANNNSKPEKLSQPLFNVGLLGNVSAGKSSVVRALTGIETTRHSKEKERGITMKIGYANCKIFKCTICPAPQCYYPSSSKEDKYKCSCGTDCELVQHISFIDCPGHESLMNTMLSGGTIMDYAILLIDGSQKCPQPQTVEHLMALEILQVRKILIIQNKLDLIDGNRAMAQYKEIKEFVKGTCAENSPIIPMSAQKKYNLDTLCEYLHKYFEPIPRTANNIRMNVIRSFDINKPGCEIIDLKGGVLGGSILSGALNNGEIIEIRPGLVKKDAKNVLSWAPITTKIISMQSDNNQLGTAMSGGLIGVCTSLDPSLCRSDRMVGQVVGIPGTLPDEFTCINAECKFLKRTDKKTSTPKKDSILLLNISSKPVRAIIVKIEKPIYHLELQYPCCMVPNEKFSISTAIDNTWKLIGMGRSV